VRGILHTEQIQMINGQITQSASCMYRPQSADTMKAR